MTNYNCVARSLLQLSQKVTSICQRVDPLYNSIMVTTRGNVYKNQHAITRRACEFGDFEFVVDWSNVHWSLTRTVGMATAVTDYDRRVTSVEQHPTIEACNILLNRGWNAGERRALRVGDVPVCMESHMSRSSLYWHRLRCSDVLLSQSIEIPHETSSLFQTQIAP